GRFLHLTDMHPDPHYRIDASESTACHRRKPKKEKERGGYYGLPYGDCDSPLTLTNFTLDFLEKHWADEVDFVIWTGDSARHDNDRELPRTPSEIYELNRAMVRRMNEVFTSRGVPVVPCLGNNDVWRKFLIFRSFSEALTSPNSITNEFANIWRTFIPFESFQVFQRGGYYSVEVIPGEVAVISLNTMYFYDSNKAVGGCEYMDADDPGNLEYDWLEVQLDRYRERGMQVWLSGHVPPSPGNYFPGCFVRYADVALRYQDTILGHLFGHMNVDHFFFLQPEDTVLVEDESAKSRREEGKEEGDGDAGEESHSSLAETLMEDFSSLPKKGKTDLDDYVVINVAPSVVPNPYLPTFRVFAFNKKDKKKDKKKSPKRDHGHRHPRPGSGAEVDCKKKANRETWACRERKPQHASGDAPSRTNRLWTPLGYAQVSCIQCTFDLQRRTLMCGGQYWLPKVGDASKGEKPKFKLEYVTYAAEMLSAETETGGMPVPVPGKELPKTLSGRQTPYGMRDLTIGSWLELGRRLGDAKKEKVRKLFRRYMYQGGE
ncbi:Metallo-dependent phosphatase-like protein, partial [Phellopilus nigrolimitatus]